MDSSLRIKYSDLEYSKLQKIEIFKLYDLIDFDIFVVYITFLPADWLTGFLSSATDSSLPDVAVYKKPNDLGETGL